MNILSNYKKINMCFYPELLGAAFCKKEMEQYLTWWILKNINKVHMSDGCISTKIIYDVIQDLFAVDLKRAYVIFNKGIGTYWYKPGGMIRAKKSGLMSKVRVYHHLQPKMSKSQPFKLSMSQFIGYLSEEGWLTLKSLLVAMVAARFPEEDFHPVSIATIVDQTGLSETTVHRMIAESKFDLVVRTGWALIYKSKDYANVYNYQKFLTNEQNRKQYRIFSDPNSTEVILLKQIPNNYALPNIERLPFACRPRELKAHDKRIAALLTNEKRYYRHLAKIGQNQHVFQSVSKDGEQNLCIYTTKQIED